MNEKCGVEFETIKRGAIHCNACGGIYIERVSFKTDWEFNHLTNLWDRKQPTETRKEAI